MVRAVLILILLTAMPAAAHDSWINKGGFRNAAGEYCCGVADCVDVTRQVSEAREGYRVQTVVTTPYRNQSRAIDELVPYSEVMPSQDDKFWRCQRPDGTRRCFFVPPPKMM